MNNRGQAFAEYTLIVSVLALFLGAVIAPRSPLNIVAALKKYQNNLVKAINNPIP